MPVRKSSAEAGHGDGLPRPLRELERALQDAERHGVIPHRARAVGVRLERPHLRARVVGAVRVADLQVERVARDDPEEHAAMIEADAAEHRFRRDVADLGELIQHERPERVADAERSQRPRPLRALLRLHSRRRLYAGLAGTLAAPWPSAADSSAPPAGTFRAFTADASPPTDRSCSATRRS